jgi:phosphoglycolate phosphatase-like HAD superfamily hydrolase
MPDLVRRAQSIYVRNCPPTLRSKVCPGVRECLARLKRLGAVTGLVTGNLSRIGWKKMERAGLKPYFRFGAFAESALERSALVREAIGHARAQGWIGKSGRIWYIGDHPNDIRAARANGVGSIAVATGLSNADELSSHGPDMLVEDLRALDVETLFES